MNEPTPSWNDVKHSALVALSLWLRYLLSYTSTAGAHSGSVSVRTKEDEGNGD